VDTKTTTDYHRRCRCRFVTSLSTVLYNNTTDHTHKYERGQKVWRTAYSHTVANPLAAPGFLR